CVGARARTDTRDDPREGDAMFSFGLLVARLIGRRNDDRRSAEPDQGFAGWTSDRAARWRAWARSTERRPRVVERVATAPVAGFTRSR
ncbi:MAG TPA: hypothetical protein VIV06_07235, partial [Candidatus Limnocylindrales bacterium]